MPLGKAGFVRAIRERHHNATGLGENTSAVVVRFAIRDRHVVLLGDGVDDVYDNLVPFIVEGFENGDRAVHIIDPALWDAHFERLSANGIDKRTMSTSVTCRTSSSLILHRKSVEA